MKKESVGILLMMILGIWLSGCTTEPEVKAREKGQEIWFEELVHDYGEIDQDSDGSWIFKFKNIGETAFVINRVRSTCGCTVPEWPREPVEPGKKGEIEVIYNTALSGTFVKSLYVYSSAANSPVKIQIKGKVLRKPTE